MRIALVLAATILAGGSGLAQEGVEKKYLPVRNEATFQAILNAAGEPNRDVRGRVAWVLSRIGRSDAADTLQQLAADPAPGVRAAALRAMCELLPMRTRVRVLLTVPVKDAALRNAALVAAERLFFEQRDAVIRTALQSSSVSDRLRAVRALRLDPPARARTRVLTALEDSHLLIRAAAVDVLGQAVDAEAVRLVFQALKDRSSQDSFRIRAAGCDALSRMNNPMGSTRLCKAVGDEHFFVRRAAIRALAALQDRNGLTAIQGQITDTDYTVRLACCTALGDMIARSSSPLLTARLDDDFPEVRAAADVALRRFPAEIAYRALLDYADYRKRRETRLRVWRILALYSHPETGDVALGHLEDPDRVVGGNALRILRKLGDRRAIPHVIGLLIPQSTPPFVTALQAEEALRIAVLFKLREPIPFAMDVFRRAINPPVSGRVYYPPEPVVIWSAKYAAAIRHEPAVAPLEQLMGSRRLHRRRDTLSAVAEALKTLTGRTYPLPPEEPKPPSRGGRYFVDVEASAE